MDLIPVPGQYHASVLFNAVNVQGGVKIAVFTKLLHDREQDKIVHWQYIYF